MCNLCFTFYELTKPGTLPNIVCFYLEISFRDLVSSSFMKEKKKNIAEVAGPEQSTFYFCGTDDTGQLFHKIRIWGGVKKKGESTGLPWWHSG